MRGARGVEVVQGARVRGRAEVARDEEIAQRVRDGRGGDDVVGERGDGGIQRGRRESRGC